MGNWHDLQAEVRTAGNEYDVVRRAHLQSFSELTGRNTIIYYSGWLQKGAGGEIPVAAFSVTDSDKNAFMATVHRLDRTKGLDLFLHTPGGSVAATESIVDYLHTMFDRDIRVFVPQLAMSAGSMIALSAREIAMGKHSSLGPIDPQLAGLPAHGILEEFARAKAEVTANPPCAAIWHPIISKYSPTLVGEAEKAIEWAEAMVREWLVSTMFAGDPDGESKAIRIVSEMSNHAATKSHSRHISAGQARNLGVRILALEDDQELQNEALSVHHVAMQTLAATPALKLVENHLGVSHTTDG